MLFVTGLYNSFFILHPKSKVMKKALSFSAIIILLTVSSCKKNWVCSCTDKPSGAIHSETLYNMTAGQATTLCVAGNDPNTDCKL